MKKYRSEMCEALHEDTLALFRHGFITEAELREFEADAFIDEDVVSEVEETPQEEKPLVNVTH
jgi:hypothetical protein